MLRNHPKALAVLGMLALLFTFFTWGGGTAAAHTIVGSPTVSTSQTKTIKVTAQLCDLLKKSDPAQAKNPSICNMKIVTTDVYTKNTNARLSMSPNACPWQTLRHTYTAGGLLFGFSQTTQFVWTGNCGAPSIAWHVCNGLTAFWPESVSQGPCFQYPNGSGHTQAEDDVVVSTYVGSFPAYAYSDGLSNGTIYDWQQ